MKSLLRHRRASNGGGRSNRTAETPASVPSHSKQALFRSARIAAVRKDLRASLADGASFSVMVGIGETYLAAFVLALGMGEIAAGLISSIPLLAGSVLQLGDGW